MKIQDYEGLAEYQEINSKSKYKIFKAFSGLCLFTLSVTSSILNSLMMISVATTNRIINILSLASGIIFSAYFYKNCIIDNPILTGLWKAIKSPFSKCSKKIIYALNINITNTKSIEKDEQQLTIIGDKNILECLRKKLFVFSPKGYIEKGDLCIKISGEIYEKNLEESVQDSDDLYSEPQNETHYMKEVDAHIFSDSITSHTDKIIICAKEKGAIGVFIDCMINKCIRIEENYDKIMKPRLSIAKVKNTEMEKETVSTERMLKQPLLYDQQLV